VRVRGALRLFRLRQVLFRRPRCPRRAFRRRRFWPRVEWRFRDRGFRSVYGWALTVVVDASDARPLRI
jgi:hypothetical protein